VATLLSGTQEEFIDFLTRKANAQRDLALHSRTKKGAAEHWAHATGLEDAVRYVRNWEILDPAAPPGFERVEKVVWRILSKKPRGRQWRYMPFAGAASEDKAQITARLIEVREGSTGWRFKLQRHTVITITGPWEDVDA
jgi:hypothetical protein